MNIFISSIISGMEPFRAAARAAVHQLGHTAIMAEDFGAQPSSPQVACLEELRKCALTILIIGERYGAKQRSGLSATHEEFNEARDRRPILAFLQEGVTHEADQAAFVKEVGAWETGLFRESFTTPEELKSRITMRVHQWEVATAAGPVDEAEMLKRAFDLLPADDRGNRGISIGLAMAGGPRQALLRPAEIENAKFKRDVQKAALFGTSPIFGPEEKTIASVRNHALVLSHGDNLGTFLVDGEGGLFFKIPLPNRSGLGGMVVIEEDATDVVKRALAFGSEIWESIDPTQRISHAALVCALFSGNYSAWRTRAEHAAGPNSYQMNVGNESPKPIHLNPAVRARSAIAYQRDEIAEDLITLLKRQSKGGR